MRKNFIFYPLYETNFSDLTSLNMGRKIYGSYRKLTDPDTWGFVKRSLFYDFSFEKSNLKLTDTSK